MHCIKEETTKMKKIIALLVLVMLLAGCSDAKDTVETQTANDASSTDSLDDTFYRIVKFDINENRSSYYRSFNTVDFQTIGRELEVLSTDEFSTSDYYMAEGQILKYDNMEQLTKRNNDNNKNQKHRVLLQFLPARFLHCHPSDHNSYCQVVFWAACAPQKGGMLSLHLSTQ